MSSRRACGRGAAGRSRDSGQSSSARRLDWAVCRRAATARRRPRTPPERPPRRDRSRRGSRSGWRGRGPTRRGRPVRAALPLHQRAHLDRAAHPRGWYPCRDLERCVEISHIDEDEAADMLLRIDEGTVGEQRLAVSTRTVVAVSIGCNCSPLTIPGSSRRARYSFTIACCWSADRSSNDVAELPG